MIPKQKLEAELFEESTHKYLIYGGDRDGVCLGGLIWLFQIISCRHCIYGY